MVTIDTMGESVTINKMGRKGYHGYHRYNRERGLPTSPVKGKRR